ncbi:hypothetical protein K227x_28960 [Rubripirellula lacrimiformis]|uniref:Uncharacterized protein n=1 Tax=Rubripirellula lacrimiformis TaxID=1930273 RepID=A0A517NBJ3_9BACT|nr:hypothetical protein K227x_28960 [Rubripirellula lacrimiformis]
MTLNVFVRSVRSTGFSRISLARSALVLGPNPPAKDSDQLSRGPGRSSLLYGEPSAMQWDEHKQQTSCGSSDSPHAVGLGQRIVSMDRASLALLRSPGFAAIGEGPMNGVARRHRWPRPTAECVRLSEAVLSQYYERSPRIRF